MQHFNNVLKGPGILHLSLLSSFVAFVSMIARCLPTLYSADCRYAKGAYQLGVDLMAIIDIIQIIWLKELEIYLFLCKEIWSQRWCGVSMKSVDLGSFQRSTAIPQWVGLNHDATLNSKEICKMWSYRMTETCPVKIRNLLTKNKGQTNPGKKQEVSGTKKYLLFLMSQFKSSLPIQILKLRKLLESESWFDIPTLQCISFVNLAKYFTSLRFNLLISIKQGF